MATKKSKQAKPAKKAPKKAAPKKKPGSNRRAAAPGKVTSYQ